MRRLATLVTAVLLAGLLGAVPALAQDGDMEGPYVEPGVEEPEPTPSPRVETPEETVDEAAPVDDDRVAGVSALPETGLDLTVGALLAAGLLLAGGGALLVARRKASATR